MNGPLVRIMAHKSHRTFLISVRVVLFLASMVVAVDSSSRHSPRKLQQLLTDGDPAAAAAAQDSSSRLVASALPSGEASIQYEPGFVVETILDGNRLNMSIYATVAVPSHNYVYAIDWTLNQVLRLQLPIDQGKGAEVARRVAGDNAGRTGLIDGWGEDSLLDNPKSLAVDGDGNVYVADLGNRVIRKITSAGYVSTIAGYPNKTGHADGEGKNAFFSANFDLTYVPTNCSLLVADRGNRRLRLIRLKPPHECNSENSEPGGNPWIIASLILGVFSTLLSAALGKEVLQRRVLQRTAAPSLALDDDNQVPFSGNGNEQASNMPLLNNMEATGPFLANSAATHRRGISVQSDLMSFSECPSQDMEHGQPTNHLVNSAVDSSRDAENDAVPSISSAGEEGDETTTPERVGTRSLAHDLLSDSESILNSPTNSFSRHLQSNSALVGLAGRSPVEEAINRASNRALNLFTLNSDS